MRVWKGPGRRVYGARKVHAEPRPLDGRQPRRAQDDEGDEGDRGQDQRRQ
ncbi:MAG: hypothetical protein JWN52_3039 [Actinomycetia bacterium]|nr:hypothetical protein [Actinomycetes bacterium]